MIQATDILLQLYGEGIGPTGEYHVILQNCVDLREYGDVGNEVELIE